VSTGSSKLVVPAVIPTPNLIPPQDTNHPKLRFLPKVPPDFDFPISHGSNRRIQEDFYGRQGVPDKVQKKLVQS
jgi:hypothetical protein